MELLLIQTDCTMMQIIYFRNVYEQLQLSTSMQEIIICNCSNFIDSPTAINVTFLSDFEVHVATINKFVGTRALHISNQFLH